MFLHSFLEDKSQGPDPEKKEVGGGGGGAAWVWDRLYRLRNLYNLCGYLVPIKYCLRFNSTWHGSFFL